MIAPRAPQRSRIVPRVHNKQQASDARDAALERAHPPLRRLARPCAPVHPCCDVTITSIQTLALAASSRPSKNSSTASSVSANALLHVWLMNQVASPTCCAVSPRSISHAAAAAPRERAHVHLTKMMRSSRMRMRERRRKGMRRTCLCCCTHSLMSRALGSITANAQLLPLIIMAYPAWGVRGGGRGANARRGRG